MKAVTRNQFCKFLAAHNLTISTIVHMVNEYAHSDLDVAKSYLSEKYNISSHVFYKCRDYAIICNLVDSKCFKLIKQKSQKNYRSHNSSNTARASILHFYDLEKERKDYMQHYSIEEIHEVARLYASGIPIERIGEKFFTGKSGINQLLYRAVTELIIEKSFLDIIVKTMPGSDKFISEMLSVRRKKKDELLSIMSQEMQVLRYKIENYTSFYMRDDEKPLFIDLQQELEKATQRYTKALML